MRQFVRELVQAFGLSFVGVVVSVYGVSQGVGSNWMYPAVSYLLMHDRAYEPYVAQSIMTVARLPWSIKIVYGMLSDRVALWRGQRRGPYLVLASLVGLGCWTVLGMNFSMSAQALTALLVGGYLSSAVPDVVVDAAVTERSKVAPALAPSLQSLSWGSYAAGGLLGSATSGFLIDYYGASATLGLLIVPAVCVLGAGAFLRDVNADNADAAHASNQDVELVAPGRSLLASSTQRSDERVERDDKVERDDRSLALITAANVLSAFAIAGVTLSTENEIARGATTLACALLLVLGVYFGMRRLQMRGVDADRAETIARVAVYIFAREALVPGVDAAMFAWYTMDDDGPHFTIEFLGFLSTASLLAMLGGVALYQRYFKHYSYRALFTASHALLAVCALFDVAFVTHANRAVGIPDRLFALGDTAFSPVVGRLSLMPMFALAAKLCPDGTEATLYALLMSLSNFGVDVGSYLGAVLLWLLGDPSTHEHALRNALIIRSLARLLPIALVFALVPRGSPFVSD